MNHLTINQFKKISINIASFLNPNDVILVKYILYIFTIVKPATKYQNLFYKFRNQKRKLIGLFFSYLAGVAGHYSIIHLTKNKLNCYIQAKRLNKQLYNSTTQNLLRLTSIDLIFTTYINVDCIQFKTLINTIQTYNNL